ncbi:MAG: Lrp/AsnC family transcriptional regulator [Kordiimonadaceae bacterium]|jgi:DNA-binding Lrp family transcriptional regulator|nr:Lrp/AsnC family transcriptional regulator [Kordiimonadaceae bacterium]MBT6034882.1 Lrp/AsnC family transcriptional regulator [Kordiimonadaceae bacterium]MBT6329737.1 Lrp/AsnC family transcriptional regulator [Kordiimonadaceae bacterium]MBT7582853.1 Lrp/AsnC family transcriptional regulator [Kordiimonadaceae bacterium]
MLIDLSDIDKKILAAIQHDSTITNSELADLVGLSSAPCWRRIKRLEEKGIISKRVGLLDTKALGLNITAFANVKLSHIQEDALEEFERAVIKFAEVTECYTISGSMDFILRIVTENMQSYESFLRKKLLRLPMVSEVNTHFAVTQVKYTTAVPLELSS